MAFSFIFLFLFFLFAAAQDNLRPIVDIGTSVHQASLNVREKERKSSDYTDNH
jgi:acetyl esterase/lipase